MRTSPFCIGASLLTVLLSAGATLAWNSTQGPRLHGERRHGKPKDVVWFPTYGWKDGKDSPFTKVVVEAGELVAYREGSQPLRGNALLNAKVTAKATDGAEVTYRIEKINPPPGSSQTGGQSMTNRPIDNRRIVARNQSTLYYTLVNVEDDEPYCDQAVYPPDGDGGIQAVPVAEVWSSTGTEGRNETHFTMACMGGAIAKCYHWGYQGWRSYPKATAYVQACTRMAMADYCGDGHSHTLNGTPIDLWDLLEPPGPIHPPTGSGAAADGWSFETAWTGGDGQLPSLDRHDKRVFVGGALCLSKLRWSTMKEWPEYPPESPPRPGSTKCRTLKQDPLKFTKSICDWGGSVDTSLLQRQGALLFNNSQFLDAMLSVWTSSEKEHWTTAGDTSYPAPSAPLGTVLSEATPESVTRELPRLVPLMTYFDGYDHLTTTRTPPEGYDVGSGALEGQIYACEPGLPRPPHSIPVYRYKLTERSDYLTTTAVLPLIDRRRTVAPPRCAPQVSAPDSSVVLEGYLPVLTAE